MNNLSLFMLMIGCKPEGRLTEQHDTFFTIAEYFTETEAAVRDFWPESGKIHIDAWKEVTMVDGYRIKVVPRSSFKETGEGKLFFINLGGYKKGVFDEFHYKLLTIAKDKGEAIKKAKQTAFFQHTGFESAPAHVDDKYGVDVDDVYEVTEILAAHLKEMYALKISEIFFEEAEQGEDEIHQGYQRYEKMKKA